ncbi:hypothetical protein [Rivularia sp. UHCC 0363]|nr:hypothetical protein [Rivularia sp. UHCC 0363]MEA5599220.1 hypothetical protein [Rivularia sp. UHCC 0363]
MGGWGDGETRGWGDGETRGQGEIILNYYQLPIPNSQFPIPNYENI